jgi:TRAP transporter TAXI family solute receptor
LCLNKPTTSAADDINHIDKYDFIIAQSPVSAIYANKYDKYVRSVMNLYEESGNFIVNTKSGIKSFKDLEGKKVYFGVKGSSAYNTFEDLAKIYNVDISKILHASKPSPYYMEDLCQNKIDAVFMDFAHPNAVLANAIKNCKIKILSLNDDKTQHLIDEHHHYIKSLIPYNDYNLSSDVYTIGHAVSILTKTHMDKDVVYEITKTIFDNFQEFKSRDILLTRILKHEMVDRKNGLVFRQHDGAMKYYNVNRDQTKQLFIIILYGGSFNTWGTTHKIKRTILPFISQMKNELGIINDMTISNNQHIQTFFKKTAY